MPDDDRPARSTLTSWIPDRAGGDTEFARVFGLRPNLLAHYEDFYARLWAPAVMDPAVLELCRLRVAQLLGCDTETRIRSRPALDAGLTEEAVAALRTWPTAVLFDDTTRACIGFAEQFVIDPALIGDEQRAEVRGAIGWHRLVGLALAVATFDGFDRFRLVLSVGPGPAGTTVVDVGEPDPSAPAVPEGDGSGPPDPARGFADAQPAVFASFERLYGVLWSRGVVDHPSKEVARLRNARVTGCKFCRNVRFARARDDGLDEDMATLIADGYRQTSLSDAHKAVIALTDVFLRSPGGGLDGDTARTLLARYGSAGTVELTAGLALFMGFSKIAVALGAFPDDFATTVIPTPNYAPPPT